MSHYNTNGWGEFMTEGREGATQNLSGWDGQFTTNWEKSLAKRTERMTSSMIRETLKMMATPGMISFGGGNPAPELFPLREFQEACRYVLEHDGPSSLQYSVTEGFPPLRQFLVEKMRKYGVPAEQENILIVNGSQQALDLVGKVFLNPGDAVLTDRPTYLGAIQAWSAYEARFATVPLDDDGTRIDHVEEILRREPVKFIYCLPNFHNPAGVTLSLERRKQLVELAARHGVFIVEDDPYGELRFEGEDLTPLVVMHKENTIYLSTFSKTLAPGIRIGWIVAPAKVLGRIVQAKQGADLHTSSFVQMIANDICQRGFLRQHVRRIRDTYRERCGVMLAAMDKYFPEGVRWTRPKGGLFLWVILPEGMDSIKLLKAAIEEKVAFIPGPAFYPDGKGQHTFRMTFATASPEMIEEGIRRLGKVIKSQMKP
ncbi:MAG: 2-aminoadipate transaminase [Chloroflexi bacterium ADurb.Bin180]|nr:MAG: 2-aminoadipate transaminase [Chloroflexi bacterium ADurb.Bin180]